MSATPSELRIPASALRDSRSRELVRVWVAEGGQHVALNLDLFADRAEFAEEDAWGKVIADLTRHLANAIELRTAKDHASTVKALADAYNQNINAPQGAAIGGLVRRRSPE